MCETFGFSDWEDNDELLTNQGRIEARDWLLPELSKRLGFLSKNELMLLAEKAAIPFAPVNKPADLVTDRQMNESGSLVNVKTQPVVFAKLPKPSLRMNGEGFDLRRHPPKIGEGSVSAYQELGFSKHEFKSILEGKVIQVDDEERSLIGL